jgi:hypothetical protein
VSKVLRYCRDGWDSGILDIPTSTDGSLTKHFEHNGPT